jgi:hypothetical protein
MNDGLKRTVLTGLMIFLIPLAVFGQETGASTFSPERLLRSNRSTGLRLLDPSKISMSQDYMLAFRSGGSGTGGAGLIRNTLMYQLSSTARLQVHVGVEHPLFRSSGSAHSRSGDGVRILPGFDFMYRPSDRMSIQMSLRTYSSNFPFDRYQAFDPGWGRFSTSALQPPDSRDWRDVDSP